MKDKEIYMRLEDDEEQNQSKSTTLNKKIEEEIKEQPVEAALESVLKDINMKTIDGMVNISIPEPAWQILSVVLTKLLFHNLEEEKEIRR